MTALTGLMTERGYPLSALYAATMPIYRKQGWELAGARYEAAIPARALQALAAAEVAVGDPPPIRRPGPADAAEIIDVIGRVHEQARDCGPITVGEPTMRRWLTAPSFYADTDRFTYLAPDGFLAYRWQGGHHELVVDKVLAVSAETTRALWSVVASHASVARTVRARVSLADPIWWLLREQDATIADRDPWMLRLLDAPAAIAARGFPAIDIDVPLHITDNQVPRNSGPWQLTVRSTGKAHLVRTSSGSPAGPPLALGARGLAALYAGTPVATLRRAGLASAGTPESDAALDAAFAATPFMLDDF
jgi:predicted acetyltransferase